VDPLCYEAPLDIRRKIALTPLVGGFVFKQLWGRTTFRAFFKEMVLSDSSRDASWQRVDDYYESFNSPASRGSALATMRATLDTRTVTAQTTRITIPSLIVWGRHDRLYPAGFGHRLAREIRGAGFELMNAGHAPHEELPEEFAEVVWRFLRAQRPAPP
jgi:pimeloyl-ACP methyl ester carboxylesterase